MNGTRIYIIFIYKYTVRLWKYCHVMGGIRKRVNKYIKNIKRIRVVDELVLV